MTTIGCPARSGKYRRLRKQRKSTIGIWCPPLARLSAKLGGLRQSRGGSLQRQLRSVLGHEQIVTQTYGRHLLIKRLDDEEPTVVARLTELARNRYSAAFRSHTGRWEPLPGTGSLDEMAEVVVTLLQPYLQPDNY